VALNEGPNAMPNGLRRWRGDTLYQNSLYLAASTGVMALLGFVFWALSARLFDPADVGIATTIGSLIAIVTSLSNLGTYNALVRFLPGSSTRGALLSAAGYLVALAAALLAALVLWRIDLLSPELVFLRSPLLASWFVLFAACAALNLAVESALVAHRSGVPVLAKSAALGGVRIVLPLLLVSYGAMGIAFPLFVGTLVALVIGVLVLTRRFGYRPAPLTRLRVSRAVIAFALSNYVAGLLWTLPATAMPVVVTALLGPRMAAFAYVGLTIAGMLYIVPTAVSQSLFAEAANDERRVLTQLSRAMRLIALLLAPGVAASVLLSAHALRIFGAEYAREGAAYLSIMAVASFPIAVNLVCNAVLNIEKKTALLVALNASSSAAVFGLSIALARWGLNGMAAAWALGYLLPACYCAAYIVRLYSRGRPARPA
jgi:O-antigen/teichoic acid export membrane protein